MNHAFNIINKSYQKKVNWGTVNPECLQQLWKLQLNFIGQGHCITRFSNICYSGIPPCSPILSLSVGLPFDKAQVNSSLCVQCLWLCWIRQFNCIWKQNAGWLQCAAHWSVYVVACPEYRVPAVRYLKTRILITDWSELWSHDLWNDYMKSVLFCLFTWYLRFDRHQRMLFFGECCRESVTLHHCLYVWYYNYDSHCQINNQCQDQIPLVDYCVLFYTLIQQTVSIKQ